MTKMLASIRSLAECRVILDQGIDILDLKEPRAGALGALKTELVQEIVTFVQNEVLISATIGDVLPNDQRLLSLIEAMNNTGVDIVKVGLFAARPTNYFIDIIKQAAMGNRRLVVVLFAENYIGIESVQSLLDTGIAGLMLDTKNKSGQSLNQLLNDTMLKQFVETVNGHGLLSGFAGSLQFENIDDLLRFKPDYLGFRGALCTKHCRTSRLDLNNIKKIRGKIPIQPKLNLATLNNRKEVLNYDTVA